jgi:hypothetical protein
MVQNEKQEEMWGEWRGGARSYVNPNTSPIRFKKRRLLGKYEWRHQYVTEEIFASPIWRNRKKRWEKKDKMAARKSKTANVRTVEPGYNDIGWCDTSSVRSDILWYQLIRHS